MHRYCCKLYAHPMEWWIGFSVQWLSQRRIGRGEVYEVQRVSWAEEGFRTTNKMALLPVRRVYWCRRVRCLFDSLDDGGRARKVVTNLS